MAKRAPKILRLSLLACAGFPHIGAEEAADNAVPQQAPSSKPLSALAMSGGGFRVFSVDTGLTVGLLVAAAKMNVSSAPMTLEQSPFWSKFDAISSISGSSWFTAELAYSPSFVSLLESMAEKPTSAGKAFGKAWMDRFLALGRRHGNHMRNFRGLAKIARDFGNPGLADTLEEVDAFWSPGLSWREFNAALLYATGHLKHDLRLGSPVVPWAQNKTWVAGHSLVTGRPGHEAYLHASIGHSVHYTAPEGPEIIPATFSVKLGAGSSQVSPLPLVVPSVANDTVLRYEASKLFGFWRSAHTTSLKGIENIPQANLPLSDVVSASSALLGGTCLKPRYAAAIGALHSHFVPWMTLGNEGAIRQGSEFAAGRGLIERVRFWQLNERTLREVVDQKLVGSADGGYVDNTGIANAVALGASEITVFGNTPFSRESSSWLNLFRQELVTYSQAGLPLLRFPIFKESVEYATSQEAAFVNLVLPRGVRHLKAIRTGTIRATTTDSKWFGISAGHTVNIRIVSVVSDLSVGGLNDFKAYNTSVQEIVDTIASPDNEAVVREILR